MANTKEEFSKIMSDLAFRAGIKQYEIHCAEQDLEKLNAEMQKLNLEYVQSQAEAK